MTTWKDVRERIEAILATIPAPDAVLVLEDARCPLTSLPAVLVVNLNGRRQRELNHRRRTATRTFVLTVLVAEVCGTSIAEQRIATDAAEDYMEVIPDFFARYAPTLELDGVPLAGVFNVGEMVDEGTEIGPWLTSKHAYAGFTLTIPITLSRHY